MNKKKYIDADIVNKKLKQICDNRKTSYGVQFGGRAKEFAQITDDIPAADVKEIQHGYNATNINPVDEFICSVCGFGCIDYLEIGLDNDSDDIQWYRGCEFYYCPHCGAKIDKSAKRNDGGKE
jgi:hypothetical protein